MFLSVPPNELCHISPFYLLLVSNLFSLLEANRGKKKKRVKWLWCVDTVLFLVRGISAYMLLFHASSLSYFLSFFLSSCILFVCIDFFSDMKGGADSVGIGWVWCVCASTCASVWLSVCICVYVCACVCCIPTLLPDSFQGHHAYNLCNFTKKRLSILFSTHLKVMPQERLKIFRNSEYFWITIQIYVSFTDSYV